MGTVVSPPILSDPERGLTERALAQQQGTARGKFVVIPLGGAGVFVFDFFPTAPITLERRANWPEQDTTRGTKPLFYENRDPRKLGVQEVYLDRSDTSESITPQIEELMALQDEIVDDAPPPCLVLWGDRQERAVLENIHIEETFHRRDGSPIRARVTLEFKELQGEDRGRLSDAEEGLTERARNTPRVPAPPINPRDLIDQ
jgi:hypothetical protein